MNASLDLLNAWDNPQTRIIIAGSKEGNEIEIIRACVIEDVSFQIQTNWNNPLEDIIQDIKNMARKQLGMVEKVIRVAAASTSISAIPRAATIKQYVATPPPSLALNLMFLAFDKNKDIRRDVNSLMKYVLPEYSGNGVLLMPPGGYSVQPTSSGSPDGVLSLRIGTWFKAHNIMIISGAVSPLFSKEVTPAGYPLYATMQVTFTPYRAITYSDWSEFFV